MAYHPESLEKPALKVFGELLHESSTSWILWSR